MRGKTGTEVVIVARLAAANGYALPLPTSGRGAC
jgi:hypothetical protein